MARRKPKGITDAIADYIKSTADVFDRRQRPMEMPQVTQFRDVTRSVVKTGATAADLYFTGGLAGSFQRNVMVPGTMIASPATKARAEEQGLKRFVKDAAIVGATAGAGRAVVGGVRAVQAGKVVNPVAKAKNVIKGEKVVVVGTKSNPVLAGVQKSNPKSGVPDLKYFKSDESVAPGKYLPTVPDVVREPQTIFPRLKDTPVRWAWDPSQSRSTRELAENATQYANKWRQAVTNPVDLPGGGKTLEYGGKYTPEIAVGTTKKKGLYSEPVMPSWSPTDDEAKALLAYQRGVGSPTSPLFKKGAVASTNPVKVVSTVKPSYPHSDPTIQYGLTRPIEQIETELARAIRRAGGSVPRVKKVRRGGTKARGSKAAKKK